MRITNAIDIAGGIAGAGLVLLSVLLLVEAVAERQFPELAIALALATFGLMLALKKGKSTTRVILGGIALCLLVASWVAALFLPNLR